MLQENQHLPASFKRNIGEKKKGYVVSALHISKIHAKRSGRAINAVIVLLMMLFVAPVYIALDICSITVDTP